MHVSPEVVKVLIQHNVELRWDELRNVMEMENTYLDTEADWLPIPENVAATYRYLGY